MTDDEKARAELEALNKRSAELKAEIERRDALRDLRVAGASMGLSETAPLETFVGDFQKSEMSAEAWLRQQTTARPYWFTGDASTIARQVDGGDPFALDTYSLARQRGVLRDRPDVAKALLTRRSWS